MKKIFKQSIAFLLAFLLIMSLCSIGPTDVYGATHNVHQSRRIAEIEEFPESYRQGLRRVQSIYPNARFVYYDTDLDWYNDVLTKENHLRLGINLIPSNSPESWKSKDSDAYDATTNTYTQVEPGWNQASKEIIEYYMDPRNFFNEKDIFQFMDLSFTGAETVESTQAILNGSFMENKTIKNNNGQDVSYAQAIYDAGKETGVSPYLLACRIRQEQGSGSSALISGTYSKVPGYYNYFNVGAYGSSTEQIITRGLNTAKEKGWNTPYKAIVGGAQVLSSNYVGVGKNCLYLQHFNMTATNNTVDYRIYMANTLAPYNENRMMTKSLNNPEAAYTFIIPVYDNMPATPCEPPYSSNSADATLDSLYINNGKVQIENFNPYVYKYETIIDPAEQLIILKAKLHTADALIYINGIHVNLDGSDTLEKGIVLNPGFNDIIITVQGPNGLCRDYELTVKNDNGEAHYRGQGIELADDLALLKDQTTVEQLKSKVQTINCVLHVTSEDGKVKDSESLCAPGDKIMIINEAHEIIYTSKIDIFGDINGDGAVSEDDVQLIKEYILEISPLSFAQMQRADINMDKNIDVIDLGLLRLSTGVDLNNPSDDLRIYANVPEEIIGIKDVEAALTVSNGTYFAEGFLLYNEGQLELVEEENSGMIHFIADGNQIMFDTQSDALKFKTIVNYGNIVFDVVIKQAYDYLKQEAVTIATEPRTMSIKNTEIDVDIEFSDDPIEGANGYKIAKLKLTNKMNKSTGNFTINFGQYMVNGNGKRSSELTGLRPGDSHQIDVLLVDELDSAEYTNAIKINYTTADAIERMIQIDTTFNIKAHQHTLDWKQTSTEHYIECDLCKDAPREAHRFICKSNGVYVCMDCGYKNEVHVSILNEPSRVNAAAVFEADVKLNNKSVKNSDLQFEWYVDGTMISNSEYASCIFRSVGNRKVQCVVRTKDNFVCMAETVFAPQNNNQKISVTTTCSSIIVNAQKGYEYRIGNGKWQVSPVFSNLSPGNEYKVQQRRVNEKQTQTSINVYVGHNFKDTAVNISCDKNITLNTQCANCKATLSRALTGTQQGHAFTTYTLVSAATCQSGDIEVAKCDYGCGATDQRTINYSKSHSFTKYVSDGNSSCANQGTESAKCDYGCGEVDTRISQTQANGHVFEYVYNNDATAELSGTETGTCTKCGLQNIRTKDGTRLKYVTEIQITLDPNVIPNRLPYVKTKNNDVSINVVQWIGPEGEQVTEDSELMAGQSYSLSTIIIKAQPGFVIHKDVFVYVNGNKFADAVIQQDGTIKLTNVGQFKF